MPADPGAAAAICGGGGHPVLPGGAAQPLYPALPGAHPVPCGCGGLADRGQRGQRLRLLAGPLHRPGGRSAGGLPLPGLGLPGPAAAGPDAPAGRSPADPVRRGLQLRLLLHRDAARPGHLHPAVGHPGQRLPAELHGGHAVQLGGQAGGLQPGPGAGAGGGVPGGRGGRLRHPAGEHHRHHERVLRGPDHF